jgi:hypothetical protein
MISGGRPAARAPGKAAPLLCAVLSAAALAQSGEPAAWDVERLMQELRQVKSDKARFTERKDIAILNGPLESSGTLVYVAPAHLEKRTLAPRPESLVLDGDRLTLESGARKQSRTFALQEYPAIWAFVESIRSTLAGDLPTLNRFYQVSLDGGERRWSLTLKPVEPKMRDVVSEIRIGGSRNRIGTVEIVEGNGDRSLMTIARDAQ